MSDEAFVVEPGWVRSDPIESIDRRPFRLLTYADGTVRFEHRCDRGERGTIICAPALAPEHVVSVWRDRVSLTGFPLPTEKVTVTPSILCPDCGTHGFITDGRWADA